MQSLEKGRVKPDNLKPQHAISIDAGGVPPDYGYIPENERLDTQFLRGLGKGESFKIWQFLVTMLDFWGVISIIFHCSWIVKVFRLSQLIT